MATRLLGTGGAATLPAGTTETVIFDSADNGGKVIAFELENVGSADILVRVKGMHLSVNTSGGTGGMARIKPGAAKIFVDEGGIEQISGYGDGIDVAIRGSVRKR